MKNKSKTLLLLCLVFLLVLFLGYFLLAYYYREGFSLNTWINGVYCTGKTVEEVNTELLSKMEAPIVIITDKDGITYSINMQEVGYQCDYLQPLNRFVEQQNPLLWVDNIMFHQEHVLTPAVSYDEELLRAAFEQINPVRREREEIKDYRLQCNKKNGYEIYDGLSDSLDIEKAYQMLKDAIDSGTHQINLVELDCYYDIPLSEEQEEIKILGEKLAEFQHCNIVFDMGDAMISLDDASVMSGFVKANKDDLGPTLGVILDENGNLVLDEEAVASYIAFLAEEYDTYGKEREFLSTRGDIVTVKSVTYGTLIDQEAEVKFLMENLLLPESRTDTLQYHIPAYERQGVVRGKDDIGSTYIEIDMTEQMMYYYEDGELMLETEVVTGNTRRKWGTPEGINYVYAKQKNRILRGEGYASPVKYWMPVKGNIGIHDASWRSKFGGTIYQKNGSHGCINTPTEKMTELYEMVEIGTPVIMFY